MPKKIKPSIHFGLGDLSGWTPVGISSYRSYGPTAAIRELIQNGLDAASVAKTSPAHMLFRLEKCYIKDIPGIDKYHEVFTAACKAQVKLMGGNMPDNAKAIIEDIRECLKRKTCEVLHVLDNGVGLNDERMRALLADGLSVKDEKAAGSYGNGHIVAFPASNLRYVLYGGLNSENLPTRMICAGHAILATTASKKGASLSKDGYFVNKLNNDLFNPYDFPENNDIPPLIRKQLTWIQNEWETGSVISIVGFNHFRNSDKEKTIMEDIFRAASCNFFEAINRKQLVIEVEENGNTKSLDKDTLERILEGNKDQQRSADGFLAGNRAYDAFRTLKDGKKVLVPTNMGNVNIVVKYPVDNGQTRHGLCRNGMWITDQLPKFQNQFGKFTPFHCVIPLLENTELNRLVRKAEGPLHNGLSLSLLSKTDKDQLSNTLLAIRDKLREIVPALDDDSFRPKDIFLVRTEGLAQSGRRPRTTGTMTIIKPRRRSEDYVLPGEEEGGHQGLGKGKGGVKNPNNHSGSFRRSGSQIQFQGLVVPTGLRSCNVSIVSGEKTQNSEIRFAIDESIDVTTHDVNKDVYVIINPDTLQLNDSPVQDDSLRKDNEDNVLGIVLGGLNETQTCSIKFDYSLPDDLLIRDDQEVVLKAEMIRRATVGKIEGD